MSYRSSQDPEEKLPDWLKDLRKRQSPKPIGDDAENQGQDPEKEPDWLKEIRERYGNSEPSESGEEPVTESPKVLGDTQPIPKAAEEMHNPGDVDSEQGLTENFPEPEDLKESWPEEPAFEQEPGRDEEQAATRREFPDWLKELGDLETEDTERGAEQKQIPAFSEGAEDLTPGELPSWLEAIRPSGFESEEASETARPTGDLPVREAKAGPLAGLSGILPAEPEAIQSIKPPVYSTRIELTESQTQHVEALKRLLDEEGKPRENVARGEKQQPTRLLNLFAGALLFFAILIPTFTQSQTTAGPDRDVFPEVVEVFERINILPEGESVLVVFDLEPALLGETKAAASAVLNHLLDRKTYLVFISTQPTGPGTAEYFLSTELSAQPLITAKGYINLGYLSGGMAAIRSFVDNPRASTSSLTALGLNPWASSPLESIHRGSDFALVVIISGNADDVRAWIEQGSSELSNGLIAVTSAQADPLLQPYLHSQPEILKGLVSGVQEAVLYEDLRAQSGGAKAIWNSYSYGLGAIFLIALLGGLYGRLVNRRPRQPVSPNKDDISGSRSAI